jgi:uncharacterized protein YraI
LPREVALEPSAVFGYKSAACIAEISSTYRISNLFRSGGTPMRPLVAILVCSQFLLASPVSGEPNFPYKTCVSADDVYVRSGPGQNYYPTDKLKRGQELEVYRHDPGGWCAIRPVEGSFTWVSARFLKPTENNLAVVTEEGVSARVGSRFSDVRDVVQVRLQKGETVEILEGPPRGSRNGEGWFKIAPPSGEFRWVSAKYLDSNYPRDGLRKALPPEKHAHRGHDRGFAEEAAEAAPAGDAAESAVEPRHRHASHARSLTAEEYRAELDRIELELSVMLIEAPTVWSFDALRQRADGLLDQAQTAVERGRARLLVNKIARFDDIKQRQDSVLAMRDEVDRDHRLLSKLRPLDVDEQQLAPVAVARDDVDGRFDGIGRLTQVASPKLGAPRYALVNNRGDVQCYVTPAPGVNLQYYVGQRVGLTGNRGYVPEQHSSHIMARHVTPLDGSMLR